MKAVEDDGTWKLTRRTDGVVVKELQAKDLWDQIGYAAWCSADPGLQFDTTINDWHTCPAEGRINASNPCSEYMFLDNTACNLASMNLMRFLDTAYHKARSGSKIVLETINPACWYAFFESYIRDITHVRPLHPDTLKYLILASGFQKVEVRYREPFPDESKLQPIARLSPGESAPPAELTAFVSVFNENVTKLNQLLFTYLDYVVIGERI